VAKKLRRVAVDTCVVLDYLLAVDQQRADRAEYLLNGHGERHQIVLPAIVIPELAGNGEIRGSQLPKEERADKIAKAKAWLAANGYIVAELSERLAKRAADLAIDHQLKGADATVLATAEAWGCEHLYTRDHGLLKCDGQLGYKITEPGDPPEPEPVLFPVD
jgi:predicted nucleic acid-binding protein